nr:MAG TPA: hypothetical protein [Caudoviricetes sp.]
MFRVRFHNPENSFTFAKTANERGPVRPRRGTRMITLRALSPVSKF